MTDDQVASDIAGSSAEEALRSSGIDRETLDYIIVAHNFGDIPANNLRTDLVPSLAARVKQRLGIRNPSCIAYDLPFGCPGWLQGVIQADYFLRSGDATRAMVIGAETLSRVSDPHDRDAMLYSDGAGCAILEARTRLEPVGVLAHAARSDTLEHASLMWMGTSYNPDYEGDALFLKMQGHKLYEYAVTTVPGFLHETLQKAGLSLADVDKVLMHQANARLNEKILRRLFRLEGCARDPRWNHADDDLVSRQQLGGHRPDASRSDRQGRARRSESEQRRHRGLRRGRGGHEHQRIGLQVGLTYP